MNIKAFMALAVVALTAACTAGEQQAAEEVQATADEVQNVAVEEAPQAPLGENEQPR